MTAPKIPINDLLREAAIVMFMLTVLFALDEICNLLRRPTRVIIDVGNFPETGPIIEGKAVDKREEIVN